MKPTNARKYHGKYLHFQFDYNCLELSDKGAWTALRYADNFDEFVQFEDNVDRINENEISCEEFIERYEKIYKPVIILGCQVSNDEILTSAHRIIWLNYFRP